MTMLVFLVILIYFIFFIFGFISYAFNSYGLYEIAKKEGIRNPYIAWIPYINRYILGKIAFKSIVNAIILVILNIIELILLSVILFVKNVEALYLFAIISLLLSIVVSVYTYIAHYRLYRKYSKSTIIMTILDVVSCGILGPFFIFAIRNNEENK